MAGGLGIKKNILGERKSSIYLHPLLRINMIRISLLNCNGPNVVYQQERTLWSPLRQHIN